MVSICGASIYIRERCVCACVCVFGYAQWNTFCPIKFGFWFLLFIVCVRVFFLRLLSHWRFYGHCYEPKIKHLLFVCPFCFAFAFAFPFSFIWRLFVVVLFHNLTFDFNENIWKKKIHEISNRQNALECNYFKYMRLLCDECSMKWIFKIVWCGSICHSPSLCMSLS